MILAESERNGEHHIKVAGSFDKLMEDFSKHSHAGDQLIFTGDNSAETVTAEIVTIVEFPQLERRIREVKVGAKVLRRRLSHIKNSITSSPAAHTSRPAHQH